MAYALAVSSTNERNGWRPLLALAHQACGLLIFGTICRIRVQVRRCAKYCARLRAGGACAIGSVGLALPTTQDSKSRSNGRGPWIRREHWKLPVCRTHEPSHHVYLPGCALTSCKTYATPLGEIATDLEGTDPILPRVLWVLVHC